MEKDGLQMAGFEDSDEEVDTEKVATGTQSTVPSDRIVVFQSAHLAYFDRTTAQHHTVPLLDFEYESSMLKESLAYPHEVGAGIQVVFENATIDRFPRLLCTCCQPNHAYVVLWTP
jgi:hypothetical protein